MTKAQPSTRHIISINDLSNKEIETIFEVAQGFLQELADRNIPYRIGRSTNLASKFILASLLGKAIVSVEQNCKIWLTFNFLSVSR